MKKIATTWWPPWEGGRIHPINVRVEVLRVVPVEKAELTPRSPSGRLKWGLDRWRSRRRKLVAGFESPTCEVDYEFVSLRHPTEYPFNRRPGSFRAAARPRHPRVRVPFRGRHMQAFQRAPFRGEGPRRLPRGTDGALQPELRPPLAGGPQGRGTPWGCKPPNGTPSKKHRGGGAVEAGAICLPGGDPHHRAEYTRARESRPWRSCRAPPSDSGGQRGPRGVRSTTVTGGEDGMIGPTRRSVPPDLAEPADHRERPPAVRQGQSRPPAGPADLEVRTGGAELRSLHLLRDALRAPGVRRLTGGARAPVHKRQGAAMEQHDGPCPLLVVGVGNQFRGRRRPRADRRAAHRCDGASRPWTWSRALPTAPT